MTSGQPSTAKRATLGSPGVQYWGEENIYQRRMLGCYKKAPLSYTSPLLANKIGNPGDTSTPSGKPLLSTPLSGVTYGHRYGRSHHMHAHARTHTRTSASLSPPSSLPIASDFLSSLPSFFSPLFSSFILAALFTTEQHSAQKACASQSVQQQYFVGIYFQQAKRSMSGVWSWGLLFMCFRDYYGATLQSDLCLTVISSDRLSLKQRAQPLSPPQFSLLHSEPIFTSRASCPLHPKHHQHGQELCPHCQTSVQANFHD